MDSTLPVVQVKESHDLKLDPGSVPRGGAFTLAVARYPRLSIGDRLTLTWQGFFDDGFEDFPYTNTRTVQVVDQVPTWQLDAGYVDFIRGGHARVGYRIVYADAQGGSADAELQTLEIVPPTLARLPAASIEGNGGSTIDPDDYPQGLPLTVRTYPGIQAGDYVLCYAAGAATTSSLISSMRVEQDAIARGELSFTLDAQWLRSQLNETVTFEYQYARPGAAQSSAPLSLSVRTAWRPNAPVIDGATAEEPGPSQGFIEAVDFPAGIVVRVPANVELGAGDKVEVHWQGYGSSGSYIAITPAPDDRRKFAIPASAIPANMGKRLKVFYTVERPGEALATSRVFDLRVIAVPAERFSTVQCGCVDAGKLLLSCVPGGGVDVTLNRWLFMAAGQRVTIRAESSGSENLLENLPVTQAHITAGKVVGTLRREFLQRLSIGANIRIRVFVSFDEGFSQIEFRALALVLAA